MKIYRKYEEIYPPDVNEFIYITDHTYTRLQVFRMEQLLLKVLAFDLSIPTVYTFLSSYATITKMSDQCKFLAMVNERLWFFDSNTHTNDTLAIFFHFSVFVRAVTTGSRSVSTIFAVNDIVCRDCVSPAQFEFTHLVDETGRNDRQFFGKFEGGDFPFESYARGVGRFAAASHSGQIQGSEVSAFVHFLT